MAGKGGTVERNRSTSSCSVKRCMMTRGLDINDLFDDYVLLQILCRLPLQSAVVCKLICKRWLSLISTHDFVSCFISKHHRQQQLKKYLILKEHRCCLFLTSQVPSSDVSFSFLPVGTNTKSSKVKILASSDDLFLCSRHHKELFLCNPFTKKWLALPPPPPSPRGWHRHFFGFTCKPYYEVEGDGERVTVNSSCSFRVVRLKLVKKLHLEDACTFELDIFSSQTWQWTATTMQSPLYITPVWTTSHNGLLYWKCFSGQVVVHDPYNNNVRYVIDTPQPQPQDGILDFRFSVSEGSLLAFESRAHMSTFRVWELEEWDHLEWRLKIEVELQEYLVNSSEMFEWAGSYKMFVVASHPNDKDVFFLWSRFAGLGIINLKTRVWKPRFLPTSSQLFIRTASCQDHPWKNYPPSQMAVIKASCWPTPISALLKQSPTQPAISTFN